jgi:hypothetical protein
VQGYDSETTIVQGAGSAQKSGVRTDRFTRSQRVTRSMTSRADRGGMLSCIKSARPPSSIAASWTQQAMAPICQRKRSWLSTERAALAGGGHAANAVPDDPRVGINAPSATSPRTRLSGRSARSASRPAPGRRARAFGRGAGHGGLVDAYGGDAHVHSVIATSIGKCCHQAGTEAIKPLSGPHRTRLFGP